MKAYCYESSSFNPYYNLALEESFGELIQKEKALILYFWQNDNTIVIGRNQNAYTECNLEYVRAHNITIARRKTGGGAVYHDKGNLNYSVILPMEVYDKQRSTKMIVNGLHRAGIFAEVNGRNDILLNGKKISGNAYYSNEFMGLHHGTILFDVNLDVMKQSLNVSEAKLAKRGIKSVKSRVANLCELYPKVTMDLTKEAIMDSFREEYDVDFLSGIHIDKSRIETICEQYRSKEWVYEKIKDYGETHFLEANGTLLTVSLECDGAYVRQISIASDSLDPDMIELKESTVNEAIKKGNFLEPEAALNMIKEAFSQEAPTETGSTKTPKPGCAGGTPSR